MPSADLPLEQLRSFKPPVDEPADFDTFWAETISTARAQAQPAAFTAVDTGLALVDVFDVRFSGFGGERIAGWFILPKGIDRPLPAVVSYLGYGAGRGFGFERIEWAAAGYAQFVMDNRGMGASLNGSGDTSDTAASIGPQAPGYSTRGLLDPHSYVIRRLYTDGVLAVDAVASHPAVDTTRIAVAGLSLGGGTALAVASLRDDLAAALIDAPALCCPRRALQVVEGNTYKEIWWFLRTNRDRVDEVFRTLSYVDGANFATRASTPAFFSTGLMDPIVPPSSVFGAYNRYAGPKRMRAWEFNQHEAGGAHQFALQLGYLRNIFGP
jgi:cephalosporin-C deacetylase